MLLGEQLGRRHERGSGGPAATHRARGEEGDRRLAAADVALEQAVHRVRAREVGAISRERARLRAGEAERQARGVRRVGARRRRERDPRLALARRAPQREAELEQEQLLEDQPLERGAAPLA